MVAGLDWSAFVTLLPQGGRRPTFLALARAYEGGLIEGAAELAKKNP